jgi:hypothetical protein
MQNDWHTWNLLLVALSSLLTTLRTSPLFLDPQDPQQMTVTWGKLSPRWGDWQMDFICRGAQTSGCVQGWGQGGFTVQTYHRGLFRKCSPLEKNDIPLSYPKRVMWLWTFVVLIGVNFSPPWMSVEIATKGDNIGLCVQTSYFGHYLDRTYEFFWLPNKFSFILFIFFFFFLVVLGFELRASHLLGRLSISWATP